ncbi:MULTISPECIES: TIGR02466 family protein [unclassified Sphingomonas]|uniref:TIGR02466 family protein n=1 Tax=unclassified Sphingomonas TaxID=196159 RepID=UPI000BC53A3C|nr:MAG: hypothetical protein B7Z43_00205 [Sphingomonas sp. 12-62-6]OYX38601.1 MAG: hypothetical protein B7Y98_07935 [Sphingomonas sp. 32-62-10]
MTEPQKILAFATPVISVVLDHDAGFNAELARVIRARRDVSEGVMRSNVGGWHSDTRLLHWAGEQVAPVIRRMVELADANIVDTQALLGERRGWLLEAWANINPPGSANAPHVHGGSFWSGVYYVAVPEGEGGEITFDDPRLPMIEMHAPMLRFRDSGGERVLRIKPVASQLLLFPAWLRHAVEPWQGEGERISIAVNLTAPPLKR